MKNNLKVYEAIILLSDFIGKSESDLVSRICFFDENLKPYSKEFLEKVLNYLEQNEMYEDCNLLHKIIKERFDHDLNYKNILI